MLQSKSQGSREKSISVNKQRKKQDWKQNLKLLRKRRRKSEYYLILINYFNYYIIIQIQIIINIQYSPNTNQTKQYY